MNFSPFGDDPTEERPPDGGCIEAVDVRGADQAFVVNLQVIPIVEVAIYPQRIPDNRFRPNSRRLHDADRSPANRGSIARDPEIHLNVFHDAVDAAGDRMQSPDCASATGA